MPNEFERDLPPMKMWLRILEQERLRYELHRHNGNVQRTAEALGVSRYYIYRERAKGLIYAG